MLTKGCSHLDGSPRGCGTACDDDDTDDDTDAADAVNIN